MPNWILAPFGFAAVLLGGFCLAGGSCFAASDARLPGDVRLIDAVKNQNRKAIDALIQEHVDVNAAQPDGATPLAWAVYLNQVDTVDRLMKAGAKVATVDEYGESPLTLAWRIGNATPIE